MFFFFFKQKTAYEMRISDWSSDVCSSDLQQGFVRLINRENRSGGVQVWGIDDAGQRSPGTIMLTLAPNESRQFNSQDMEFNQIGRASCRKECVSTCRSRWSPNH